MERGRVAHGFVDPQELVERQEHERTGQYPPAQAIGGDPTPGCFAMWNIRAAANASVRNW